MTGFIESAIDSDPFDYLGELFKDSELADCALTPTELERFLAPPQEKWTNVKNQPAVISMDEEKATQWELACEELNHVRERMQELLGAEENDGEGE